ncbi:MAG TPA: ATP-binding protein [Candidatus Kapabacteria bacterium]|nr:ATP-binding protein [Candidatus Kapabacteria bacterium]
MKKNTPEYLKYPAFINRENELNYLKDYINISPESILFVHGPKSSGKTTLLYKFFAQIRNEQKLNVKFLDLRKTFTNVYEDFLKTFFSVETKGEKKETLSSNINVGFFKIDSTVEKKIQEKRADPFKVMEAELLELTQQGIKPVLIIDELQALDKIYLDNDKERQLIKALFNFFVAMTKQAHLAHIIIASSDGYFLNTIYNDSKLKKCSTFYEVNYLMKKDVMEWLLNLEKYSKIKDYTLTETDAEKIWDTVGGSMWEIQDILSQLFEQPIDDILAGYKQKMLGMITYYAVQKDREKRENILKRFIHDENLWVIDTGEADEVILKDMVSNNILYFDPARAVYYPQGKSYHWGIRMYFERLKSNQGK